MEKVAQPAGGGDGAHSGVDGGGRARSGVRRRGRSLSGAGVGGRGRSCGQQRGQRRVAILGSSLHNGVLGSPLSHSCLRRCPPMELMRWRRERESESVSERLGKEIE